MMPDPSAAWFDFKTGVLTPKRKRKPKPEQRLTRIQDQLIALTARVVILEEHAKKKKTGSSEAHFARLEDLL